MSIFNKKVSDNKSLFELQKEYNKMLALQTDLLAVGQVKMHYAKRYKERIRLLEKKIEKYYLAIYHAKELAGINPGICGVAEICGNEERPVIKDAKGLKQIINDLPLIDCGV